MPPSAAVRSEAQRLLALFTGRGAEVVETDILQPAGPFLDLYGEDIRARAYRVADPIRGEMMLRPDHTVPLLRRHIEEGAGEARYAYAGEVFRRQERAEGPSEYVQVGYEVIGAGPEADAEVLAAMAEALAGTGARPVTGDIGLLIAAVDSLDTTDRRKAALMRHIWRPARFDALLDRFAGPAPERDVAAAEAAIEAYPENGLRTAGEVRERLEALREDAAQPPVPALQIEAMRALEDLSGPASTIPDRLSDLARALPGLAGAATRMERRVADCRAAGLPDLPFDASHGRGALEYYDGMVFAFAAPGRPPVATGGRYDALATALGGEAVTAVGGVIRPHAL